MNTKVEDRAGGAAVRVRIPRASHFLLMVVALVACGCGSERWSKSSFAHSDSYRPQFAVSDVQSFLYLEPSTHTAVPQVRSSLRNLGHQTLAIVEFTLSFKNRSNQIIFEKTAYPIYVSALS